MTRQATQVISSWSILDQSSDTLTAPSSSKLRLSNVDGDAGELILDYGRCEGGIPIFVIESAISSEDEQDVPFRVVYSETREGIDHDTGEHRATWTALIVQILDSRSGRRWSVLPLLECHGYLQDHLAQSQHWLKHSNHKIQISTGIAEIPKNFADRSEHDNRVLQNRLRKNTPLDSRKG